MSFVQRIISVSASRGNETALVDSNCSLSYSQLRKMSNALAHQLRGMYGREEGFVALLLPRSVYFPVSAVGVLKAGYAFVPMSADNPPEYNLSVLSDSAPLAIVSTSDVLDCLEYLHSFDNVILADELLGHGGVYDEDMDQSRDEKPGVLIYTSGTTGNPKAVLHSLGSLYELLKYSCSANAGAGPEPETRAAVLDFCFLAGVLDFFASLMTGGKCLIVPDDVVRNIDLLASYLNDNDVHSISTIGSVAKVLAQMGTCVRYYRVTGGQMPVIEDPLPCGVVIRNSYGMTECGACLCYSVKGAEHPVPVGKPVPNVKVYLLDGDCKPVADGSIGEIYISSPGLAMGYFRDGAVVPGGCFVNNPFEPGARMFRTGDLARMLPTGDMLYCGRRDDMVKVRGVRINISEVENAAMSCSGVGQAAAVVTEKGILCLYYTGTATDVGLIAQLKCKLPSLMMPGRVLHLEAVPVSSHGKIDRCTLLEMQSGSSDRNSAVTSAQELVLGAMRSVLGFDDIGVDDDFFLYGGNSLNAVELVSVLEDLNLRVEDIYREKTARRIASAAHFLTSATDGPVDGLIGLTQFQKRVLESQLSDVGAVMWNNPLLFRLGEDCDPDRLLTALRTVAHHHPALSCVPDLDSGCLRYAPAADLPVGYVCFDTSVSVESAMAELTVPFSMSGDPLWRIRLFSLDDGFYMFMDFHHLIFDGTSLCVFMSNLAKAYCGDDLPADMFLNCVNRDVPDCIDAEVPVSLDGWAWSLLGTGGRDAGMRYCMEQYDTGLTESYVDSVRRESGYSLDVYAIAAAGMALRECLGKSDIAVNWMYANRTDSGRQNSFGAYVRMFTVFMELEDRTWPEILDSVRSQLDLCFAGKSNEYVNKDAIGGSDPVLINNLTGMDLCLDRFPFGIKRVDYSYCIRELIEYLDIELFFVNGCLYFDISCGSRALQESKVASFGKMFVSCLDKIMMV